MKCSNYNFFFPYSDDHTKRIAFNSFSGALALIDEDKYDEYENFRTTGHQIAEQDLIDDLKKGMFLLDDHVDELEMIKLNMLANRFSTSTFGLTLAVTSDCNFRCVYCYEKDVISKEYMTEEVQDKVIEMLMEQISTIHTFSVAWYGGEPLIALDVIERLSNAFIRICKENNVTYIAGIITNGYLLTRETAEKLMNLGITTMQITLDGMPETHNKRRPLADGTGSYDTIIKNLKDNFDILPRITLRINVDKNNLASGKYIYDFLKENNMLEKIKPYFGQVVNDNKTFEPSDCLNTCDYAKADYEYSMYITGSQDPYIKYPAYKANFCGADFRNSFVIGPNGNLYKCWTDIGYEERCIGNISGDMDVTNDTYYRYLLFDPTSDKQCSRCKLLPVCMGGCPNKRLLNDSADCTIYKYILEMCIKNTAQVLKAQKAAQQTGIICEGESA